MRITNKNGGVLVEDVPPEEAEQEEAYMESQDSLTTLRMSGRKRKPPPENLNSYENELQNVMSHFIMTQYLLKKEPKKNPVKDDEAVIKEITQLNDWYVMEPLSYGS